MAINDIYRLQLHYQALAGPASTGLYYRETALSTANGLGNQSLVFSFIASHSLAFKNVLVDDYELAGVQASKVFDDPDPTFQDAPAVQNGARVGTALPANNRLLLQLFQTTFPRTSDGRMYLPGLSEADTSVGKLLQSFIDAQVAALVTVLSATVLESGGTGVWEPGVISAKVRDAALPAKNWPAAFAPIVGITGWPVIARQVRTTTKVKGYNLL